MEAKLYKSTGEIVDIAPKDGKHFTLEEMQEHVGGYIEILRLNNNTLMIMDEEGKLKQKTVNLMANDVFFKAFKLTNDYIVGNVIICDKGLVK